jgi:hypothetical protein
MVALYFGRLSRKNPPPTALLFKLTKQILTELLLVTLQSNFSNATAVTSTLTNILSKINASGDSG